MPSAPPRLRLRCLVLGCLVSACSGDDASPSSLPTDGSPGTYALAFEHAGVMREAIVHVPGSYEAATALPMVMNFHGFGGTSEGQMSWTGMQSVADAGGFIAVFPQGTDLDGSPHWNTSLPSADNKSDAEDFGFIDALIDTIAASYAVDADRVYAAGYSNGGMFSFALACYRTERIAAVASVSGAMLDDIGSACTPAHPTSVITLHGTEDSVIAYDGGGDFGGSAQDVLDYWVDHNEITDAPETSTDGAVTTLHYTGGAAGAEVMHHRVDGGGHVWFERTFYGETTSEAIWSFFSRFDRNGAI